MTLRATDILPLQRLRTALRIVGEDAEHDALLEGYIIAAATFVEQHCRLGIIDGVLIERRRAPSGVAPLVVRHRSDAIRDFGWRPIDISPVPELTKVDDKTTKHTQHLSLIHI